MAKPEIRLKGFEGEWKAVQLRNILTERHVLSTITDELPQLSFTIQEGVIFPQDRKTNKRDFLIKDITNKRYLITKYDDIIYNPANVIHGAIHRNGLCDGVVSPIYKIFESDQNAKYVECIVRRASFIKKMTVFIEGTVLKLRTLKPESFLNMDTYIACSLEEQKQIAGYFKSLDTMMLGVTKKIASLKQMKQACLVSMFPQATETKPRVRFKGFKGEWIDSKLGEIFSERVESNIDGEMLSVTMNNGIIKASENGRFDNSNSNKSHYKVVKVNDIAYNSMRMWQGASGCSSYEGIVSPAYTVVTPVDGIHSQFFAYMFKTLAMIKVFRLHSQGLTSDTWNLKYPAFSQIGVLYPKDINEQKQIAAFFRSLDSQISLQEQRLEKLKQIKSACLDKMFV